MLTEAMSSLRQEGVEKSEYGRRGGAGLNHGLQRYY